MHILKRLAAAAIVPVVVLDNVKDAIPTAKALLAGGVDVMEITFRTAAAADSIKAVAENCPDMLVGAGTVITLEQCKKAVECGAKFIGSPGFFHAPADDRFVKARRDDKFGTAFDSLFALVERDDRACAN